MALTINNQFEIEARQAVDALRKDTISNLAAGMKVRDYESYREEVGFLRALDQVEAAIDDIHSKMEQR